MYDNILVPTDGSDTAEIAVDHALDLAETYGATIHALYVVDVGHMSITLGPEQVDRIQSGQWREMDELRERAESAIDTVTDRAEARGIEAVDHVSAGKPHSMIAKYAKNHDIDLVVMGSQGRSGVKRALLGSVTERTLRETHIPVLVVDARAE